MHKNVRFNEFSISRPDTTMHCIHADGLAKLERLNPVQTHDASRCNYSLGRQLFLDLYTAVGDAGFGRAFSNT